jgi:hypothetical protein
MKLGQSLTTGGVAVFFATDVYMAMARLATGGPFGHVVVEAAALDDYERAFLTVAPDYFPDCSFYVPIRSPLDERVDDAGRFEALPADMITDAILGIRDAEIVEAATDEDDSPWSQPRVIGETGVSAPPPQDTSPSLGEHQPHGDPLARKLSTDGGIDESRGEPSLHDSVRERMGAKAPPPRRRPPGATDDVPAGAVPNESPRISREEMNALLGDDDEILEADDHGADDSTREDDV